MTSRKVYRSIRQLAEEHADLEGIIVPLVNEVGVAEAARRLGVDRSTISRWLKANDYVLTTTYRRQVYYLTEAGRAALHEVDQAS